MPRVSPGWNASTTRPPAGHVSDTPFACREVCFATSRASAALGAGDGVADCVVACDAVAAGACCAASGTAGADAAAGFAAAAAALAAALSELTARTVSGEATCSTCPSFNREEGLSPFHACNCLTLQ